MQSSADRLTALINDNFDLDDEPSLDSRFSEAGISSVNAVAFFKLVNEEFDLGLQANDCQQFESLRDIADYIDARSS